MTKKERALYKSLIKKADPKRFEMAVERIIKRKSTFCCYALDSAGSDLESAEQEFLTLLYRVDGDTCEVWFGYTFYKENQLHRINALLLTAEIIRQEKRRDDIL